VGWTLAELAAWVGGEVVGDPQRRIERVATLDSAGPDDLSFLTSARYLEAARASRAGALLAGARVAGFGGGQIVVARPALALARLLQRLHPAPAPAAGVHPTAVIGAGAEVDPSAAVGPYAVVGEGGRLGARVVVHAHAVVGAGCEVGAGSVLHPHVVLYPGVRLGERVVVHAGTVLGADGFGYAADDGVHVKVPQLGGVEIGDDVEIGALAAVDRATLGATRVGAGTKIDNLVQVGHNVEIGRGSILCGQVGVAGSAKLGDGVVLGGQSGVGGHLEVGARVQVASKSALYDSVPAGRTVAGIPAVEIATWRRQQALGRRLAEIWRRLRGVERRLDADQASGGAAADGEE
jgi:UDP-3-O-[3-hydroxymyristoyl] glucosamine N-acyltransferase